MSEATQEPQRRKISLYEEDIYGEETAGEEMVQLVVFRLAEEWYGVKILKTREVIRVEKITYLPSCPPHIVGIVNLRGEVLSVTDLTQIFGLEGEPLNDKTRLVVIEAGELQTGIFAHEVAEVFEVPVSKIDPPLSTLPPEKAEYIEGQCKIGEKFVGILNTEKILLMKEE